MAESITVETTINAPVAKVWDLYNNPEHITKWNSGSDDWHTPRAENDLRTGGKFKYRMEPKEKENENDGFDFTGIYDEVIEHSLIRYTMGDETTREEDKRRASVEMKEEDGKTNVKVTFEAETENPIEFQKAGWQGILDKFKTYVESQG